MKTKEILKQSLDYTKPVTLNVIIFNILQWIVASSTIAITGALSMASFAGSANNKVWLITAIPLLIIAVLALTFYFFWVTNSKYAILELIVAQQKNHTNNFKQLWRNSFKINFNFVKSYFWISTIAIISCIACAIFLLLGSILFTQVIGEKSNDTLIPYYFGTAGIAFLILNFVILMPISYVSLVKIFFSNDKPMSAIKYGFKIVKTKFYINSIIPTLVILITASIATLLEFTPIIGAIAGGALMMLINPFLTSYYLINFYNDQTKIEENTIISAN